MKINIKRGICAAAMGLLMAGASAQTASAHILYSGGGLSHQTHQRDINFYNGAGPLWNAVRWGQLEWHGRMGGSLRFPSTSHDASYVHAVDAAYGGTNWYGYAYNAGYHAGHGHLQLNTSYGLQEWQWAAVACHELGHMVGMAHSADASDCMENQGRFTTSIAQSHVDQLRGAWNSSGH